MKVKTLKKHGNGYGDSYLKKKGVVYEHPAPAADIKNGFVKETSENVSGEDGRSGGHGKASVSTETQRRKKKRDKSDVQGVGTNESRGEPESAKGRDGEPVKKRDSVKEDEAETKTD